MNSSVASTLVRAAAQTGTAVQQSGNNTQQQSDNQTTRQTGQNASSSTSTSTSNGSNPGNASAPRGTDGKPLTLQQQQQVDKLVKIDKDTRTHEQAHLAAAGGLAVGGPNYNLTTGPDGKQYANGGDVQIDVSEGRTPEETVRKARIIQAAALAPVDPSAQDLSVAAQASAMEAKAQAQIAQRSPQSAQVAGAYQPELPSVSSFSAVA
ncbi:putative metalloprotease CJM1_0395 family protein [Silvimonas amylolytica]|uniref:putative metalloprotease CJM1_0395 family protein n=1 Tax=Silvimonas amylolytica TaxID=449663 RepID=UPI001E2A44ED|nr:putative metalloprotease CJM1_0395 family protein [Silvimonas amylolytica]